jgi:outer membrane protein OmpA-like peptidoglycan-associated protein
MRLAARVRPLLGGLALLVAAQGWAQSTAAALPPEARVLLDDGKRKVWVLPRPGGRYLLHEQRGSGPVSATAGRLEDLKRAHPDIDFSTLPAAPEPSKGQRREGRQEDVRAARDRLADQTPGARKAIDRALHRGQMIELTADALEHMVKGMGGNLAMPREQLDALLAVNGNRIGLTASDMKLLMKEAGPQGITLAQIEEMLPRGGDRLKPDAPAGRQDKDCPGLVYGTGKRAICLPLGKLSFADAAVSFKPGARPSDAPFDFPGSALGEPNYRNTSSADFISLGCDGELVVQFTDNVLVDVDGVDLYIFEIGPIVERTELAISVDGREWIEVGVIEGARSDVDIRPFARKGERYSFVRLRNAGKACGGNHAGADIDAIAAVGAEIRLSLDSALLFDVGQSVLKPEALSALDALAQQVQAYGKDIRVTVEGHTDSTGADAANLALSEARARSVWNYLGQRVALPADRVSLKGYGESRPVASNDNEEGRAKNRRVDLLIAPLAPTRRSR